MLLVCFPAGQICTEAAMPSNQSFDDHLRCEVTGRPCCIGILAKCVIATLEFCNYMKGRFHEEATLCSQVCMCVHPCVYMSV